jgi:hypothetical protein
MMLRILAHSASGQQLQRVECRCRPLKSSMRAAGWQHEEAGSPCRGVLDVRHLWRCSAWRRVRCRFRCQALHVELAAKLGVVRGFAAVAVARCFALPEG